MFSVSVKRIFEISGKASVVESLLSEVTGEISEFCNSAKSSNTCIGMFRKVALLEMLRNPLLTGVADVQSYSQACSLNS